MSVQRVERHKGLRSREPVHAMRGSYDAQIAEVTVENSTIRVNKVICAADCGVVIKPDTRI